MSDPDARRAPTDVIGMLADLVENQNQKPAFGRDADLLDKLLPVLRPWNGYFDAEVRGWEKVPDTGPILFVANHSGGALSPDTAALLEEWYTTRGVDAPLVLLGFDFVFSIPVFGEFLRRIGAVPANPENAEEAFADGAAVVVYPGGDHEVYRPWADRNKIDFAGRRGFVKTALRNGVPIVPLVGHGGHATEVVVTRGERIARALGLNRIRTGIFPFSLLFPVGFAPSWVPHLPLPAKITLQVCDPIEWPDLGPDAADDADVVAACYDEVTSLMQETLSDLAAERPMPVVSRLLPERAEAALRVAAQ